MAKMAATSDCERTATVTLPTAASTGFISGELGTSAALDAFSTVYTYELPLARFEIRQTDRQTSKQTDMHDHSTSLNGAPTRGKYVHLKAVEESFHVCVGCELPW